jgi:hypothetical protein
MILDICGGEASEIEIAGAETFEAKPVYLRPERLKTFIGMEVAKEKCEENLKIFEDNIQKYLNFQNFIISDYYGKTLEKETKKGNISSNLTDISSMSNIKSLPSLSNNSKGSLMNSKNEKLKKTKKS